jgi:hypothetical protein
MDMQVTPEQLIAEGRRLQRPSLFLRPQGPGPIAAVWHERDRGEIAATGHHCWLTVDASQVPGLPASMTGYLSIFTDQKRRQGGRVERALSWPKRAGIPLYAHPASVLPPVDAVFARGSPAVANWIGDAAVAQEYERVWMTEFPLYFSSSDIYAVLGGWHFPWPDDDWADLIDERLMILTLHDSEPWVEAWHLRSGEFRVVQRTT